MEIEQKTWNEMKVPSRPPAPIPPAILVGNTVSGDGEEELFPPLVLLEEKATGVLAPLVVGELGRGGWMGWDGVN